MSRQLPESPAHDELRGLLLELFARAITTSQPADQLAAGFFRKRGVRARGARAFLASTLFALLRRRIRTLLLLAATEERTSPPMPYDREFSAFISPEEEAVAGMYRWLAEDLEQTEFAALQVVERAIEVAAGLKDAFPWNRDLLERPALVLVKAYMPKSLQMAAATSLPPEIVTRWTTQFGPDAAALAKAMSGLAPLDVRIVRHVGREKFLQAAAAAEVPAVPLPYSPDGVRLLKKIDLKKLSLPENEYSVQDEGSQLITLALDPEPGSRVLDACAGAGGKTLHLADIAGKVFAHDNDAARLQILQKRVQTAGNKNVRILDPATEAPFDAVLIDAPCTGLGRMRREPGVAWRGPLAERLAEATALQRQCLEAYAPLVQPGGIVVYAVCTLEREETSAMMDDFFAEHPEFEPDPLPPLFQKEKLPRHQRGNSSQIYLLPSIHETDGFFIARFRRKSAN